MVRSLVMYGANVKLINNEGKTPIKLTDNYTEPKAAEKINDLLTYPDSLRLKFKETTVPIEKLNQRIS